MRTEEEFNKAIEDGTAKVLTISDAMRLKGKKIEFKYFGYAGQNQHEVIKVGDVISEYDYNLTQPMEGYSSRSEYWEKTLSPKKLKEAKDTLLLLNGRGQEIYLSCLTQINDDIFTGSDADRYVYFIEVDDSEKETLFWSDYKIPKKMAESVKRVKKLFPSIYGESYHMESIKENRHSSRYLDYCELSDTRNKHSFIISYDGTITDQHGSKFFIKRDRVVPVGM